MGCLNRYAPINTAKEPHCKCRLEKILLKKMKILVFTLFLVSLLLSSSLLVDAVATPPPVAAPGSCDEMCNVRCQKAGIYKRCFRYCGICCNKCKCVPSGTFGNKSECPCYRDMVNAKGQTKCP